MPTPKKGPRLGGSPAHQKLIVSNLATALFEHGRITTTEARARVLRPVAEKLITKAKRGDLHNRREVLKTIRDKSVVHTLFTEIAPTFEERPGGYTRITKIASAQGRQRPHGGHRAGDREVRPEAGPHQEGRAHEEGRARRPPARAADEVVETEAADEVPRRGVAEDREADEADARRPPTRSPPRTSRRGARAEAEAEATDEAPAEESDEDADKA